MLGRLFPKGESWHLELPMAPKAMKAKKAVAKSAVAKKPKAVKPASIVEAIDVEEADGAELKQTEAKALKKVMLGNFESWPELLTHMTFVDGLNLVDTLARDRTRARADLDFKLGKFLLRSQKGSLWW